jgi:hypothetical protein
VFNGLFFALSLPLWKDIIHDLGFLQGAEVRLPSSETWAIRSTAQTQTWADGHLTKHYNCVCGAHQT